MSVTPTKIKTDSVNFIPKEIITPNKDSPGISKTVYSHITSLHHLLSDWSTIREKGLKICKSISALKLYEYKDDYYPHQTKPLTDNLLEALDSLENVVEGVGIINNQMQALAQLQYTHEPVINTWPASEIAENILNIYNSLRKEFNLKKIITENIAHCRDENLIEVYVSSWEFDTYFSMELSAYLFADVGLAGIT
ncbi:cyclin-dependent kinase 2-interacting protein-like [Vanessa cardui]|uniref:cyclin-dependent kinase 2-interacting protein-like n=1 Tax=Vanessa cardui TaxID=171605 RepID=UPI001F13946C|nr:cyclin-dependent kinase 2-interacting protein-like [Vanessa cardui]